MHPHKPSSIIRLAVLALCVTGAFAQTPSQKEPDELVRLRQDYNLRRESALKPVEATYRQQLESLVRSLTSRGQLDAALLVRKELDALTDGGTDEEPLRKALLESKWSWFGSDGQRDVVMTFAEDGTVSHRGMHGKWKITSPREVQIDSSQGLLILHFDGPIKNYNRVGKDPVHGSRLPP